MLAKQELMRYENDCSVWAGKYKSFNAPLHWHHDYEILYIEKGHADICCNGVDHVLHERQAFFIHSGLPHSVNAGDDSVIITLCFKSEIANEIFDGQRLVSPVLSSPHGFVGVYSQIMRESAVRGAHYKFIINNILIGYLIRVLRSEKLCAAAGIIACDRSMSRLLTRIDKNYAYITAEDCADFMGFCRAYFSNFFHRSVGVTFVHYLNSVKVEKAIGLMRKNPPMSMTDIAMNSGFNTIRNFNRIFKVYTGFVPKQLPKDYSFNRTMHPVQKTVEITASTSEMLESFGGKLAFV